jgi:trimeric autotransporter adhesin
MRILSACLISLFLMLSFAAQLSAQQTQVPPAAGVALLSPVPRLIKFSGALLDSQGQPVAGPAGVTFALYSQQSGGAALWMETQNVETDGKGNYTVMLGANSSSGVPAELFTTGEARWLGVQPEQQAEQPRILLVSVPYALKAGDAQTLGGLPASAFAPAGSAANTSSNPPLTLMSSSFATGAAAGATGATSAGPLVTACTTLTADGTATANFVAKFSAACQLHQSMIFDNGTNVAIGNTAPAAKLDVSGSGIFRGSLKLPATGTANSTTKGFNSQPFDYLASVFNGTAAVNQDFRWQSEPVNPGLSTASGKLNLLFASGTATPAETGLSISNKGLFTFASGQTFPGTITGITTASGSGLQGGVTSGTANLSLIKTCATGQILAWTGTAWACRTVAGTGTVTSVGLSAPSSDFTVSGSPVTTSGTLGLAWKIAPTNADTANAIVKRDASGSFLVTSINGLGTIATTTANATGISGSSSLDGGFGVVGEAAASGGTHASTGVLGTSQSTVQFSSGVKGRDVSTSGVGGVTVGILGQSENRFGIGVLGFDGFNNNVSNEFMLHAGFERIGVWGDAENGGSGNEGIGVVGTSDTGVGVFAENNLSNGVWPALLALGGSGASGAANNGAAGISATGGNGGCCDASGTSGSGGAGIIAQGGTSQTNVVTNVPSAGVGGSFTGGSSTNCSGNACGADGIRATPGLGQDGMPAGLAGDFAGDIFVSGAVIANVKDFKIDHPLDPANKYLVHSSVESSEMMNLYTGNATLDANGEATISLPSWFQAENADFRYQLTAIGAPGPNLHISQKVANNQFKIAGGTPGMEVSWQITGIRQDAYAKANPLEVETAKPPRERGFYIRPSLFGQPEEKSIEWARHPELMKPIKAMQQKRPRPSLARPAPAPSTGKVE